MDTIKCLIIGDKYTGKTTFVNKYVYNRNIILYDPTIACDRHILKETLNKFILTIWDMSGDLEFDDICTNFYHDADLVLLFFSLNDPKSFEHLNFWINKIYKLIGNPQIMIIASKKDCERKVADDKIKQFVANNNVKYSEINLMVDDTPHFMNLLLRETIKLKKSSISLS